MSQSVKMPALGESVTEGTVTRWLKSVGDTIEVDEPLLEVATDKVDTEVPSPVAGVIEKILVEEDETVEVGTDLVLIGDGSGAGAESAPAEPAQSAPASPAPEPAPQSAPASAPASAAAAPAPAEQSAPAEPSAPAGGGSSGEAITMPALGESVTEGTVTRWLKAVGEDVALDEPLLEVATDKVDTEVPSPVEGTLLEIVVGEDETVEVGTTLAYVGSGAPAPAASAPAAPASAAPAASAPAAPAASAAPAPAAPAASAPVPAPAAPAASAAAPSTPAPAAVAASSYVTPLVRKLAADNGVDLSSVTGTGVGGRIRKQDVLEAAEARKAAEAAQAARSTQSAAAPAAQSVPAKPSTKQPVSPLRGTREPMSRLRKVVASRMVESLQTSAQLTTVLEVDMTNVARLRARAKDEFLAREGAKLTYLPFFTLAATEALKAYPKLNASIDGDEIVYHGSENLGIAVDTERGLVVPVIKDAGDLNIGGFARKIGDLAARTRSNKAGPDELSGGTFTITNTGSGGALFDTPILLQPQVGILGVGTIVKRPVVVADDYGADMIAIRHMVYLAISYDHRLVDGADAARFLTAIKNRLEEGAFEADLGL
ncbi:2-oxoglutarate dehydrogenase, E2 component, dihydrolipoamide succinyltransferase [Pseudactinotalea sp. HY158]|uniref:2-oxoglutarate dehydrogenase, E2 component, dihydrolipoamide succinyltransferase n=1 Tax=Pseudactinotalea sp. HY158 TaxID=2654547 RepID=UPI00129CCAE5|nr:2-oxoglutarate dehydrogenase, E2 component, dihydrolipoamide succinyltransferase [Pseudactinotalea sp. HY158]QGH69489.1 2-oxoglutarate dehydrogenase, E2 component, dihydrolipoamide succinyltransferase [Pseudactinotalea sp. HY158]